MGTQRTIFTASTKTPRVARGVVNRAEGRQREADERARPAWLPGTQLGRFHILSRLAAGGMAELWLADEQDGHGGQRKVVLKTMFSAAADSQEQLRMFEGEAIIGLMLDHPNIVRLHDCGRLGQRPFIAMEYIDGLNLRQVKQRFAELGRAFPLALLLDVIMKICHGLHQAHELRDRRGSLNFVHRDVSPENIMVTADGIIKLIDFGAAVSRYSAAPSPKLVGKLRYVAPERLQGGAEDRRADVYSLGVILYECLGGRPPFVGEDHAATAVLIVAGAPPPLRDVAPAVPSQLARITEKAMAARAEDRYPTAAALAADLLPLLEAPGLRPSVRQSRRLLQKAFAPTDSATGTLGQDDQETSSNDAANDKTVVMEVGALEAVLRQTQEVEGPGLPHDDETVVRAIGTRELIELVAPAAPPKPAPPPPASGSAPGPTLAPRWLFDPGHGDTGAGASDLFGHLTGRPPASWFDIRRPDPPGPGDDFVAARGQSESQESTTASPVSVTGSEATRCFDRGLALVEEKLYAQALVEWEQACALEPHNRTYQGNLKRLRERVRRQANPPTESQ
jgi:eukaryotic-like serine/threonine-protein kinase